jgi:hypothetical protein
MAHVLECRRRAGAHPGDHLSGGFERYFQELVELLGDGPPDPAAVAALASRFGLELDPESVPRLVAEHGRSFGAGADQQRQCAADNRASSNTTPHEAAVGGAAGGPGALHCPRRGTTIREANDRPARA